MYCEATGAGSDTVEVRLLNDDGSPDDVFVGSTRNCTEAGIITFGGFVDNTVSAGSRVDIEIGAVTAGATAVSACFNYTFD